MLYPRARQYVLDTLDEKAKAAVANGDQLGTFVYHVCTYLDHTEELCGGLEPYDEPHDRHTKHISYNSLLAIAVDNYATRKVSKELLDQFGKVVKHEP